MADRKKHTDLLVETFGNIKGQPYSFAVLPWGATEPHNYHLPYLTDCYLAHDIAVDAVNKAWTAYDVRGMVLPPIPLGAQNPGQRELPFCLHTRYETQKHILYDVAESISYQKIPILVIMNGHGGNNFKPIIRDMTIDFPDLIIANCDWFAVEPQGKYFDENDDHAGEMETSVMMHYHPNLVDLSTAGSGESRAYAIDSLNNKVAWIPRNWAKVSIDTGVGDPRQSSAEKGEKFANVVTDKIALFFYEIVTKSIY